MRPLSLYLETFTRGKGKKIMTRTFTINGKLYQAREITFNAICELEDAGVSLTEIEQKPISTVRSYFAICLGGNKEVAGQEIEKHIINGGSLDEIMTAFREELADRLLFDFCKGNTCIFKFADGIESNLSCLI